MSQELAQAAQLPVERDEWAQVDLQVATAHRYPRNVQKALAGALAMIESNPEIAEECFYRLERKSKKTGQITIIEGKSIRLAEIVSSLWGNMRCQTRILDIGPTRVKVESLAWDLESNFVETCPAIKSITYSDGGRYSEDLIAMNTAAACSIASRNAKFKVIPAAAATPLFNRAKEIAAGATADFPDKRQRVFKRFEKYKVTTEMLLAHLKKKTVNDVDPDDLVILMGIGTALKDGDSRIEDVFPEAFKQGEPEPSDGPPKVGQAEMDELTKQVKPVDGNKPPQGAPTEPKG